MWAISVSFFTLDYMSEHSHLQIGLILLIACSLPCYLHFAFCLFGWSSSGVSIVHNGVPVPSFLRHPLLYPASLRSPMREVIKISCPHEKGMSKVKCPLSMSPLGLYQGIICNIERLKGGTLEPWVTGGGGGAQTTIYSIKILEIED